MSSVLAALTPEELRLFFPHGAEVIREAIGRPVEVLDPLKDRPGFFRRLEQVPPEVLLSCWSTPPLPETLVGSLRYVCHLCGGVQRLMPRALLAGGTQLTNWGTTAAETVAEAALLLALSGLRRSHFFARELHAGGGWRHSRAGVHSLHGRRVGFHGFGAVARSLLPLLRPFRVEVMAYAEGVPATLLLEQGVQPAFSLAELFSKSDVLFELEVLRSTNRQVVSEALLASMPRAAVFVNVARGGLVDEAALARLVRDGHLRAALDVFEKEPLPVDSPLRALDDAVLFPHVAGPTEDRIHLCGEQALENLRRFRDGHELKSQVTLEIYDRLS